MLHIPDAEAASAQDPRLREVVDRFGNASVLYAPMLWEDGCIGSIGVVRKPPKPFTDKEIALLKG